MKPVRLGHFPTPLEPLHRLSEALNGPRILIKRDDCTGLALGGNKTRKLEYLMADALRCGADTVITAGGLQSNHVRQTAAAAARLGLACHLVLQRNVDRSDPFYDRGGNLLLDGLLGAVGHLRDATLSRDAEMARLAESLSGEGARPYVIPAGGSNALGGLGYAAAAEEILAQAADQGSDVGHIVVACGTGGTQAGLVAGLARLDSHVRVLGIDVDRPGNDLEAAVRLIAAGTMTKLGAAPPGGDDRVSVLEGYGGEGYGIATDGALEALHLLATLEGIVLDPVYTGKAMAGLIDLVRGAELPGDRDVVFVHTGGVPGLFAYTPLFPRFPGTDI